MKENEIILFEDQGVKLEVNLREETVWLTQAQMSELFDTTKQNISAHIQNIYDIKIKKRKINNTIYSKYPIYSRNKNMGEIFTTKIYSLNRKSK